MANINNIKLPLVSIRCLTYNHEKYIRDALEGFVMQKTNFRFEVIVHDDASTDNTAAIIREYAEKYPDIIKPIFETENQYSKHDGSLSRIVNAACKGKYIALCEGDDYWTDPYKLQKQVNILEKHDDVTMVFTGFKTVNENGEIIIREPYNSFHKYSRCGQLFCSLLKRNFIMTLTVCIRKDCFFTDIIQQAPRQLDYNIFLGAAYLGNLYYLPETTSCYRQVPTGAMATQQKKICSDINQIYLYYANLYLHTPIKTLAHKEHNNIIKLLCYRILSISNQKKDYRIVVQFLKRYPQLYYYIFPALYLFVRKKIQNL